MGFPSPYTLSLLVTGYSDKEIVNIIAKSLRLGATFHNTSWSTDIDPLFEERLGGSIYCTVDEFIIIANSSVLEIIENYLKIFPVRCYEKLVYGMSNDEIHNVCKSSSYRIISDLKNPNIKAVSTDNKDCAFELTLRSDFKHNYT